jgi:hypothetical protein
MSDREERRGKKSKVQVWLGQVYQAALAQAKKALSWSKTDILMKKTKLS